MNKNNLATIKTIISAGEACPLNIVKKYTEDINLFNAYGPTEDSVCTTTYLCSTKDKTSPPIGRPINNTQLYILDKYLNPVPKGVAGELHIAGDGLARGYLNQPALTKEKFIDNPFTKGTRLYKTGDLVRYLEDGNIEYIGRIDDQVKIRGFRIELGEIEQQLLNIEAIKESVVLAKEDENGNKSLVAYITTEENQEIESSSIKSTLLQYLPEYMIPVAYKTIESMPLTPNGKVDKKALAKLEVEIQSSKEYVAPRNETEEKLAKIFQEVLNVERVGIYDNFFELGGHSLLTIEMINRLNKIGLNISIQDIFASPSIVNMTIKLQEYSQVKLDVPENLIPNNCNHITPDMLPLLTISQDEIDKVIKVCQGGVKNIQDIYPLSSLQEGMLFHHRLNTEFDAYILPTLLVFHKIDDFNSIIDALQYIIDRHDVLRTSIHYEGLENPIQVVHKTIKLKVQEIKISTQDNIKEKMLERMELKNLYMPLTVAPLLRIEYAQDRGTNQYYVLFKFHHIISD
ncbi:MAG: AMP-binding protein, partial [Sulfurovum sp.]|nr:AMP-binding protein [Sulfurovum sp.]